MLEIATVLLASGALLIMAYELTCLLSKKREWGENYRGFF